MCIRDRQCVFQRGLYGKLQEQGGRAGGAAAVSGYGAGNGGHYGAVSVFALYAVPPQDVYKRQEGEREGGARCAECFRLRLEDSARKAATFVFDYFTTTRSVSPHKNAERLNAIGSEMARK